MHQFISILVLLAGLGASPAVDGAKQPAVPAAVPADYVVTPFGFVHKTCYRKAAERDRIGADGVVTHKDGTPETLQRCGYSRLDTRTLKPLTDSPAQPNGGWDAAAYWSSSSALGSMSAQFVVPAPPAAPAGSTIFLFVGTTQRDGNGILQTVLQYGPSSAGGDASWAVANWYCCFLGQVNSSSLVSASQGDTITTALTTAGQEANGTFSWTFATSVGSQSVPPYTVDTPNPQVLSFGGALESYGVTDCTQLPRSPLTFNNLKLTSITGNSFAPAWIPYPTQPAISCNWSVSSGQTGSSATITYGN